MISIDVIFCHTSVHNGTPIERHYFHFLRFDFASLYGYFSSLLLIDVLMLFFAAIFALLIFCC